MSHVSVKIDNQSNWAKYREVIASVFPDFGNTGPLHYGGQLCQFSNGIIYADWSGSDYNTYLFGNKSAGNAGPFFTGMGNLYQDYEAFVMSIDDQSGNDDKLRNLRLELANQQKLRDTAKQRFNNAWMQWKKDNPSDPAAQDPKAWGQTPAGQMFQDQMDDAVRDMKVVEKQVQDRLDQLGAPLTTLIKNMREPRTSYVLPDGTSKTLPTIFFNDNLNQRIKMWNTYPVDKYDFEAKNITETRVSMGWQVISETEVTDEGCFDVRVSTQNYMKRWYQDKTLTVDMRAKGLAMISIDRPWMNDAILMDPPPLTKVGLYKKDAFFGPNGSLATIPQAFLLMYAPELEVTCETALYEQTNKLWAEGSVEINDFSFLGTPFKISADGGQRNLGEVKKQDGGKTTFLIKNQLGSACIVGVVSKSYCLGLPGSPPS